MAQKPIYVLGINAYDHDVSACLLRDGEIAFAVEKERITRQKHATGFFQEVVDYVLKAEGITLDDVDLVVRNCYVFPVDELEVRMVSQDVPEVHERQGAPAGREASALSLEVRQGRHALASSRARLQRVRLLARSRKAP